MGQDSFLLLTKRALLQEQWAKSQGIVRPEGVSFMIGDRAFDGHSTNSIPAAKYALAMVTTPVKPGSLTDIVIVTADDEKGLPTYPNRVSLSVLSRLASTAHANNIRVFSEAQARTLLQQAAPA